MTYLYKSFAFVRHGNAVIPVDQHPLQACWDAHYEWLLLPKYKQNQFMVAKPLHTLR